MKFEFEAMKAEVSDDYVLTGRSEISVRFERGLGA
jgi:hypothetical protein